MEGHQFFIVIQEKMMTKIDSRLGDTTQATCAQYAIYAHKTDIRLQLLTQTSNCPSDSNTVAVRSAG